MAFDLRAPLSVFDGGIAASAATFTGHGLIPYRDYWLLYGPLSGFVLAIPTVLLGPSIELTRSVGFAVLCCEAAAAYLVARRWAAAIPAVAIGIAAVVMMPAIMTIDLSGWPMAMTIALLAIYLQIGTRRSGIVVGLLVGLAFLCRLDLGAYALLAVLIVRDRKAVLVGFAMVAVPFAVFAVATTPPSALFEQLIWFPLVGQRQFRGLPGPEIAFAGVTPFVLSVPLIILPRLAIAIGAARLALIAAGRLRDPRPQAFLALLVFAILCQFQTQGRADIEHFSQAATPGLLLFALWFPTDRVSPARFGAIASIVAACVVVGVAGHWLHPDMSTYDRALIATSRWVRSATDPDDRLFVGLTSHSHTFANPLIVYYLADRAPAVHETMFNPGVTDTEKGQARMISDLKRTTPPYLVLDRRYAGLSEPWNDSRVPGSTLLDEYLATRYFGVCDLDDFVIKARNELNGHVPPCPTLDP